MVGAEGPDPVGGGEATARHLDDHRGRRLPSRSPGRGRAGAAGAVLLAPLRRCHRLRPRPRRQPPLRAQPALRGRRRQEEVRRLLAGAGEPRRRALRRRPQGRAQHRAQHGPVPGARVGARGCRDHEAGEGAGRPRGPPQSRGADQRRPAGPHQRPQVARAGGGGGGPVHRVRVLRAALPKPRPHPHAAPADRAPPRDDPASQGRAPVGDPARARARLSALGPRHLRHRRDVRHRLPGGHRHRASRQAPPKPGPPRVAAEAGPRHGAPLRRRREGGAGRAAGGARRASGPG